MPTGTQLTSTNHPIGLIHFRSKLNKIARVTAHAITQSFERSRDTKYKRRSLIDVFRPRLVQNTSGLQKDCIPARALSANGDATVLKCGTRSSKGDVQAP